MSILIIDDEEMIRDLAEKILAHAGFEVLSAESGDKGIEVFNRHRSHVDLVLLDLTMDGMSGLETLNQLRDISPELPCIISSGQAAMPGEIPTDTNHTYFLQKPYRARQLTEMVQKILNGAPKQVE